MPFKVENVFLCCGARQINTLHVDVTDERRIREILDSQGTTVYFGVTNHNERAFEEKLKKIGGEQVKLVFEWGNYTNITNPKYNGVTNKELFIKDDHGRPKKEPLRLWALIPKGACDAVAHPFLDLAVKEETKVLAKESVKVDDNWPIVKKPRKPATKKVLAKKKVAKRVVKKPVERKKNAR
jgi:hypothetical protein